MNDLKERFKNSTSDKIVEVVAGVIIHNGEILCAQRGENKLSYISKKFEFPGGKLEKNENADAALIREIKEELELSINIERPLKTIYHSYPDFNIIMHSFICSTDTTSLTLTEHINALWLKIDNLDHLDWAEADLPIIDQLKELL